MTDQPDNESEPTRVQPLVLKITADTSDVDAALDRIEERLKRLAQAFGNVEIATAKVE